MKWFNETKDKLQEKEGESRLSLIKKEQIIDALRNEIVDLKAELEKSNLESMEYSQNVDLLKLELGEARRIYDIIIIIIQKNQLSRRDVWSFFQ